MATVFTIYAGFNGPLGEDENKRILYQILGECGVNGYTVTEGLGMYNGEPEPCAIVTLIAPRDSLRDALAEHLAEVANRYKDRAQQEEVWVTRRQEELLIV